MSTLRYKVTYRNKGKWQSMSVNLTGDQIIGMRTLFAALPTLRNLYKDMDIILRNVITGMGLLQIENDTSPQVDLERVTGELYDDDSTLTQIYELFEDPNIGPTDELQFVDAFNKDLSPGVIVTDDAIDKAGNIPVDSNFDWIEETISLLSFDSRDGSKTVLIRNDIGPEFESGVLYALKLIINVYNLNHDNKIAYPTIYSLHLREPTKLIGFVKSTDFDIEATTKLQY